MADWSDSTKVKVRVDDVEVLMACPENGNEVRIDDGMIGGSIIGLITGRNKYSREVDSDPSDFDGWEKIELVEHNGMWLSRPVKPGPSKYSYDGGTIGESVAHLLSTPRVDLNMYEA